MSSSNKRPVRRRLFAALAVISGVVLVAFELLKPPPGTTGAERWFWLVVGVLLVGLGTAELMRGSDARDRDLGG
jgi:hypothetical protein